MTTTPGPLSEMLDGLQAKAEAATKGTRVVLEGPGLVHVIDETGYDEAWVSIVRGRYAADARFVAACDPDTILALIAIAKAAKDVVNDVRTGESTVQFSVQLVRSLATALDALTPEPATKAEPVEEAT